MAREIALSFALGARLQSGFTAAFQSASSQAKAVSQAIRDMERTPVGKIGAAMSTQQEKIRGLSGSLKDARGELDGLWQRASQAGTMTTVMARQIEQAEARVRPRGGARAVCPGPCPDRRRPIGRPWLRLPARAAASVP